MPTETPELPFEEVASDLFEFENKQYHRRVVSRVVKAIGNNLRMKSRPSR